MCDHILRNVTHKKQTNDKIMVTDINDWRSVQMASRTEIDASILTNNAVDFQERATTR